jgi:hypothetical protein
MLRPYNEGRGKPRPYRFGCGGAPPPGVKMRRG